jgi:hypothetical protein
MMVPTIGAAKNMILAEKAAWQCRKVTDCQAFSISQKNPATLNKEIRP